MTTIAQHFVTLGMTRSDAESRAALFDTLRQRSTQILDGEAEWRRFTPGRIEIFGKHTDYAGGHSLLATVPRGIALEARRRDDGLVRVADVFDGQVITVDPSTDAPPHYRGLQRYVHVVARRLFVNFPGCALGLNIAIASDLPRASGLSSSSALTVGVALALIERAGLRGRDEWRQCLATTSALAWYLGCMENGLDFPGLPGSAGVGTHGGSEDHTAILACRPEQVSLYRFVPVTPLGETTMPADWAFVIASSGVQADKADSVMHLYNRASNSARELLRIWNMHAPADAPSLADAMAGHADAVTHLRESLADTGAFSRRDLERRLTHFVNESARAPLALDAFHRGDRDTISRLATDSQREAHELLGNQIPETVLLAALARQHGAFASSSFGAGFGGSVWAAVPLAEASRFGAAWVAAYESAVPSVGRVPWFIARPGPSATDVGTGRGLG